MKAVEAAEVKVAIVGFDKSPIATDPPVDSDGWVEVDPDQADVLIVNAVRQDLFPDDGKKPWIAVFGGNTKKDVDSQIAAARNSSAADIWPAPSTPYGVGRLLDALRKLVDGN